MHELQLQICYHNCGNWVGEQEQVTTQNLNTYRVLYAQVSMYFVVTLLFVHKHLILHVVKLEAVIIIIIIYVHHLLHT